MIRKRLASFVRLNVSPPQPGSGRPSDLPRTARDELIMRRLRCDDLEIENARLRGEVARLQGKSPAEIMAEVLRGSRC